MSISSKRAVHGKRKKALKRRRKHRALALVRRSQNFSPAADPFPGARNGQNLISWRWSLPLATNPVWWGSMHAILSYRGNRPTHTPTHKHTPTHPQTGPITIHCAAAERSVCVASPLSAFFIKTLYLLKEYTTTWMMLKEFPNNSWNKQSLWRLIKHSLFDKLWGSGRPLSTYWRIHR